MYVQFCNYTVCVFTLLFYTTPKSMSTLILYCFRTKIPLTNTRIGTLKIFQGELFLYFLCKFKQYFAMHTLLSRWNMQRTGISTRYFFIGNHKSHSRLTGTNWVPRPFDLTFRSFKCRKEEGNLNKLNWGCNTNRFTKPRPDLLEVDLLIPAAAHTHTQHTAEWQEVHG